MDRITALFNGGPQHGQQMQIPTPLPELHVAEGAPYDRVYSSTPDRISWRMGTYRRVLGYGDVTRLTMCSDEVYLTYTWEGWEDHVVSIHSDQPPPRDRLNAWMETVDLILADGGAGASWRDIV